MRKHSVIYLSLVLIIAVAVALQWHDQKAANLQPTAKKTTVQTAPPPSKAEPNYPTDEASSIWAVVDKGRALPSSYVPSDLVVPQVPLRRTAADQDMHLRAEAASAMEEMFKAGANNNINLMLASGYRSYSLQVTTYNSEVSAYGQTKADTESARPGHSEHQTGLAADIEPANRTCEIADCFADTREGKWLAENSYKYGFIIRYEKDRQNLTGYRYEPWHVRYVGTYLAGKIHETDQTLEQYFNLPAVTDYPARSTQLKG